MPNDVSGRRHCTRDSGSNESFITYCGIPYLPCVFRSWLIHNKESTVNIECAVACPPPPQFKRHHSLKFDVFGKNICICRCLLSTLLSTVLMLILSFFRYTHSSPPPPPPNIWPARRHCICSVFVGNDLFNTAVNQ